MEDLKTTGTNPPVLTLVQKKELLRRMIEKRGVEPTWFGCCLEGSKLKVMLTRERMGTKVITEHPQVEIQDNGQVVRLISGNVEVLADIAGALLVAA